MSVIYILILACFTASPVALYQNPNKYKNLKWHDENDRGHETDHSRATELRIIRKTDLLYVAIL